MYVTCELKGPFWGWTEVSPKQTRVEPHTYIITSVTHSFQGSRSAPLHSHMVYFWLLIVYFSSAVKRMQSEHPLFLSLSQSVTSELTFKVSVFHLDLWRRLPARSDKCRGLAALVRSPGVTSAWFSSFLHLGTCNWVSLWINGRTGRGSGPINLNYRLEMICCKWSQSFKITMQPFHKSELNLQEHGTPYLIDIGPQTYEVPLFHCWNLTEKVQ